MNIKEKLDKILPAIRQKGFIENQGLGNEIGFYIFDYEPEYELLVRDYLKNVIKKLSATGSDVKTVEIDLYDIMIEILKNKGVLDKIADMEKMAGTEELFKCLSPMMKPDNFTKIIKEKVEGHNLVFLTGVGKVWPLVRSHTILNNLHAVLDTIPVVMFFPGEYNKVELQLFNKFKDDNYYRAFKLIDENK